MPDARRPIRLLHHLARTGGKVISRCLASMSEVVLLSEIHPRGANVFNPLQQAFEWFQLVSLPEFVGRPITDDDSFIEAIALIESRAAERGKTLVIRDWTHLDYTGAPYIKAPSHRLLLAEVLSRRFAVIHAATVRHPLDQWLSLQQLRAVARELTVEAYLKGYRAFAERARAIGFIRYEDFAADPDAALTALCERLAVAFDPGYRQRWQEYRFVTGEVEPDRAKGGIASLPRRELDWATLARFHASPDFRAALDLLGYEERVPVGA
ncbi:MAG: hypothetical protein HY521_11525 [Proteobacteria bacterium]|nr:hypothetical protein [Pseudomonadota bacterium]